MYNLSNICVIFDIFKFQGNKGFKAFNALK